MPTIVDHTNPFKLLHGRIIGSKYQVDTLLGRGWEGEVYRVTERPSGAIRALKLFYPIRNERDRASTFYARKLERLAKCGLVVKYHHTETVRIGGHRVAALVSECADGIILDRMIKEARGKRLPDQEALMIFHRMAEGLVQIHAKGDYHGDIHGRNVLVNRVGCFFDLKLFDFYDYGAPSAKRRHEDIVDCIKLFYDMLGGKARYASVRPEFKHIIAGLKRTIINKRFPNAQRLLHHIETFTWDEA